MLLDALPVPVLAALCDEHQQTIRTNIDACDAHGITEDLANRELRAAVLLAAAGGTFLSVGDRVNTRAVDSVVHEELTNGACAAIAKREVVLRRTFLRAVAFYANTHIGVIPKLTAVPFQRTTCGARELRAVEVEVYRGELVRRITGRRRFHWLHRLNRLRLALWVCFRNATCVRRLFRSLTCELFRTVVALILHRLFCVRQQLACCSELFFGAALKIAHRQGAARGFHHIRRLRAFLTARKRK